MFTLHKPTIDTTRLLLWLQMSGVYPKLPRVAVRDSFDDEDLSDVDDEVFIRDGKNGILKIDDECGVKRPLMAPRRKYKAHFAEPTHLPYKILFAPFCYTLLGFMIILAIIVLCVLMMSRYPLPTNVLKDWLNKEEGKSIDKQPAIPCTSLDSKIQWSRTFPKFTSEAPLRSNDVNGDNVQDIIVGFSIGIFDTSSVQFNVFSSHKFSCHILISHVFQNFLWFIFHSVA